MKKLTVTHLFGIIGAISWSLTILLRETSINTIPMINFILGVMPNISATWFFIYAVEFILNKIGKLFTFRYALITATSIFLLGLVSEIIHDLFLNSPFDIYDIIVTVFAIILYLLILYLTTSKNLSKPNV